jgi:hypothetical protein
MGNELNLHTTSGLAVKAIVWGEDRATRWNGSAMVATSTISDAAWATGMVTCTEQDTSDTTGTGIYVGTFPTGITSAGEYAVEFFIGASPTPGQLIIGTQTVNWSGTGIVSQADLYHADVMLTVDTNNSQDEYTVKWYRNGEAVTSGITSPTIQVVKRADGSDLIAETAMAQVASTGTYKYDESTDGNRMTLGEAAIAVVKATINGSERTFEQIIGRDDAR